VTKWSDIIAWRPHHKILFQRNICRVLGWNLDAFILSNLEVLARWLCKNSHHIWQLTGEVHLSLLQVTSYINHRCVITIQSRVCWLITTTKWSLPVSKNSLMGKSELTLKLCCHSGYALYHSLHENIAPVSEKMKYRTG
jgi:hypothetical protein